MIAGDFSEFQGQLYHPITRLPIPNNNLAAAGLVDPVAQKIAAELIPTVDKLGDRLVWDYTTPAREPGISHQGRPQHQRGAAPELQLFRHAWRHCGDTGRLVRASPVCVGLKQGGAEYVFGPAHLGDERTDHSGVRVLLRAVQLRLGSGSEHHGPRPQRLRSELAGAHPRRHQDAARAPDH